MCAYAYIEVKCISIMVEASLGIQLLLIANVHWSKSELFPGAAVAHHNYGQRVQVVFHLGLYCS
jgi:hypothetical protein